MACSRGEASPNTHTQRQLFAASAGYCQNPECPTELFIDLGEKAKFHIAEMAHVFAANDSGPRSNIALTPEERGAFQNLILLCPTCHTKADKAPDHYTDEVLLGWKAQHANKLLSLFGVQEFSDRQSAHSAIDPILRENHAIFKEYGPNIEAAANPESGAADRWNRKIVTRILPNNRKILALLDANKKLLTAPERDTLEEFRQHVDDLSARHIEGYQEGAKQFPGEMNSILGETP